MTVVRRRCGDGGGIDTVSANQRGQGATCPASLETGCAFVFRTVTISAGAVMADVFISYARSDHAKAAQFRHLLDKEGLSVFFDVDGIDGGQVFPDVLDRELKSAGCVLGLWTPHALTRPWVKIECQIGKDRDVLVAAALTTINPSTDVPAALYGVHYIDLSGFAGDPSNEGWQKLFNAIRRKLGQAQPRQPQTTVQQTRPDAAPVTGLLRSGLAAKWPIPDAFMCLLIATITCGPDVSQDEQDSIIPLINRSRTLRSLDRSQLQRLRKSAEERLQTNPRALEEACKSLPKELRLAALAHVVDVMLADAALSDEKEMFLNKVVQFMEISAGDAKTILEVMLLRDKI